MILRRPSKWRYIHGRSSDFTVTPPLSARGPTQIADRQSLQMPSTWSMTVGDLGVRPRRLHISVFTTICARHKLDKLAVLPVIEAFAFTHPRACSTIPSRSSPMHWRRRVGIRFALVSAGGVLFGCFGSRGFLACSVDTSKPGPAVPPIFFSPGEPTGTTSGTNAGGSVVDAGECINRITRIANGCVVKLRLFVCSRLRRCSRTAG